MNIHSYPDTIGEIMYDDKGIMIVSKGDAVLVKRCRGILKYRVFWDQKWNGTCFMLYPVQLESGSIRFLELATRRVFNTSHVIPCDSRSDGTYIKDGQGKYWKYVLGMGFHRVKMKFETYFRHHISLPRLASFNGKLLHYSEVKPHRTTLLHVLALQQDNLRDLTDFRQRGGGSLVAGIFTAMTDVVSTITNTGTTIFHMIAGGATEVANDTITAVDGIGNMVAGFFGVIGGPANLGLYILNFCIIFYLVYRHIHECRERANLDRPIVPDRNISLRHEL